MSAPLDSLLIAAHDAGDMPALIRLYTQAADASPDLDAACFYLTQAYVFALQWGDPAARALSKRLSDHGRDLMIQD